MKKIVLNRFKRMMFIKGLEDYLDCNIIMISEWKEFVKEGKESKEEGERVIKMLVEGIEYYNNLKLELLDCKLNENYILEVGEMEENIIELIIGECADFLESLNWLDR